AGKAVEEAGRALRSSAARCRQTPLSRRGRGRALAFEILPPEGEGAAKRRIGDVPTTAIFVRRIALDEHPPSAPSSRACRSTGTFPLRGRAIAYGALVRIRTGCHPERSEGSSGGN